MLEIYQWESTGGCESCDGMEGFHEDEEPLRPHPHCRCEVRALDEDDLEELLRAEIEDVRWDADVDLLGSVLPEDYSRFDWDEYEVCGGDWKTVYGDDCSCPFRMTLEVELDELVSFQTTRGPMTPFSAKVTVSCPITRREASETFSDSRPNPPSSLTESDIKDALEDRARMIARDLAEEVCVPGADSYED